MRRIFIEIRSPDSKLLPVCIDPFPEAFTRNPSLRPCRAFDAHDIGRKPVAIAAAEAPAMVGEIRGVNITKRKTRNTASTAVRLRAQPRPPGTEFLDAETGCQKPPPKCANAHRDQNPGIEWPGIPAETPYLALYRKRAVCGDWMVVCAVRFRTGLRWQFPANREINREFRDSGPSEANFVARNHCAAATFYEIPYAN